MLQGLIHPLDDHYKYFLEEVTAEVEEEENSILNSNFRFAHDRVREAAYSLLEEKEKNNSFKNWQKTFRDKLKREPGRLHLQYCQSFQSIT